MRTVKVALSALAIAVAMSGTAWAADTKPTTQTPASASSAPSNTPVKHKVIKKRSTNKKAASGKLVLPATPEHH